MTKLLEQIKVFKTETKCRSITPARLGNILESILRENEEISEEEIIEIINNLKNENNK